MADEFTLTARWVFPVVGPPLERGLVMVAGDRIAAVEPHGKRKADVDLGDVAIVPGFVNTHTHLDLTGARGLTPPVSAFTRWLQSVIAFRRHRSPDDVYTDTVEGVAESLRSGTTLVGDISGDGGSWKPVSSSPLRAVVYRELIGFTPDRLAQVKPTLEDWRTRCLESETCRPGLSPHAPYSAHR